MKIKKNIILFVAGLLVAGSVLSGCTQQALSVTIVPPNIGDELTYSLKITSTTTQGSSAPTIQTTNGTIFTKVNGTKTIMDGFGVQREAIEMYTNTEMNEEQTLGYNPSISTLSYLDTASKFPIKTISNINMGTMSMSFEFYVSEKMYDFLLSTFSSLGSALTPNDISLAFEGKSIKKGDTGTITIANMTITWTALGDEKVKDYDCEKIQFSIPTNLPLQEGISTSLTCVYTLWLTSSYPSLIKMSGTVVSESTSSTYGNYQTSVGIDMLLESSKRGTTAISWGIIKTEFFREERIW